MRLPMLACDADESKIKFPCYVQPKVDGVHGMVHDEGNLTGRSLKPFENKWVQSIFSKKRNAGLRGELIAGVNSCAPNLCRATTSAVNRIEGKPIVRMIAFDLVNNKTIGLPYGERYDRLYSWFLSNDDTIDLIPSNLVNSLYELLSWEEEWLDLGYEGLIIRDPMALYKEGCSTAREGGLLRLKRFIDGEALVTSMSEGEHNGNEAKIGLTGHTERSSHKANKKLNGMLGSMEGIVCADVKCRGKTVLKKGQVITIAPGKMSHEERRKQWEMYKLYKSGMTASPGMIMNSVVKFQFFPTGGKDKPRFPTFQTIRSKVDMS